MPFRDAASTIGTAVRSILAQTHEAFELIAVDDGSKDGSAEVVASFKDHRIRLFQNEGPPGVVGAHGTAMKHASGKWIARMDSDDISHHDRLGRQLEFGEQGNLDVVGCRVRLIESCGAGMARYVDWANTLSEAEEISTARFVECPVIHPSAIMRRRSVLDAGGYHEVPWAEDHDLWLRMLETGCRFGKVEDELLDWRDSPQRLTRSDPRYSDAARNRMRCHYISRLALVRECGVVIAGAGPIGKTLARELVDLGVRLHGFLEVNPRRIGETIHGVPVVDSSESGDHWSGAVLLGAVGIQGGREKVRALAIKSGHVEGRDFWSVC